MCRLLARKGRGAAVRLLSDTEISERCSLSRRQVTVISLMDSWSTVSVDHAEQFLTGCGIRQDRVKDLRANMKKSVMGRDPFRTIRGIKRADDLISRVTPEMILRFINNA